MVNFGRWRFPNGQFLHCPATNGLVILRNSESPVRRIAAVITIASLLSA